jgi:hypothetical protein
MIIPAIKTCDRCGKRAMVLLIFTDSQETYCFPCHRMLAKEAPPIVTGEPFISPESSLQITETDIVFLKSIGVSL